MSDHVVEKGVNLMSGYTLLFYSPEYIVASTFIRTFRSLIANETRRDLSAGFRLIIDSTAESNVFLPLGTLIGRIHAKKADGSDWKNRFWREDCRGFEVGKRTCSDLTIEA